MSNMRKHIILGDRAMTNPFELERPTVHFMRGSHRFEVHPTRSDWGVSYIGFYDGRPSVVAREKHLVTRMLLQRYAR